MTDRALIAQLDGYELTTAEIHYYRLDHPSLLQLYIWQDYDLPPDYPVLFDFWRCGDANSKPRFIRYGSRMMRCSARRSGAGRHLPRNRLSARRGRFRLPGGLAGQLP